MIKYATQKSDLNRRALDVTFANLLVPTIVAIIMFPLSIYFLVIGFLFDKDALSYGIIMLAYFIFSSVMFVLFFQKYRDQIKRLFDDNAIDGVIEYELEMLNDTFYISSVQCNLSSSFSRTDISYIRTIGKTIVVRLKDRRVLQFPRNDEICTFLKQPK